MKLTTEQLEALRSCASAEETVAKAAEAGFDISTEQAEKLLAAHEYMEIGEDELTTVSGGCNSGTPTYQCNFCNQYFEGKPPHTATWDLGMTGELDACESCYQKHKDEECYFW